VECPSHTHGDDNGRCDACSASVLVALDFYILNDFHGKFFDSEAQHGVDEMTTYFKTVGESDEYTVLLSSGDMWQGSAESTATRGAIITDWMNALDFVAMTIGNHEYDWGEAFVEDNAAIADFPLLAINVYDRETNQRVDYAESSVIVERGGIKIGIIGAIGDCYSSIMSSMVEDIYFKTDKELTSLVKEESRRLRAEGVQIIVYSLHDGYDSSSYNNKTVPDFKISDYYDPSLSSGGYVDLVFEGHTHQKYVMKDSSGVYHLQGGGDNEGLSHAELKFNTVTGKKRVTEANFVSDSVYSSLEDDPLVNELSEKYSESLGQIFAPLGNNAYNKSSDFMRSLVARLYLELGERAFSEYDIVLGGGFISIRDPYYLPAGDVSYSDLAMLFPFDNQIVLCSVSGKTLKERFINTDNSNYYVAYGEYGERIKSEIDTGATYYIVVDSYTAQYTPNKLTVVEEYASGVFARDLLAEYIRDGGLA
jgi:2',3'-cyclic-nucleotide 2'-phosphodiesterase/3'-nucleotidase